MKKPTVFRKPLTAALILVLIAGATGTDTARGVSGAAAAPGLAVPGYDVTESGADGGDTADDTAAIQEALDRYDSVYIPDGVYYINADISLRPKSGQTLTLGGGAQLRSLPTASDGYSIIDISNVTDVTVTGGQLIGDRGSHKGTTGEWGMGIQIGNGAKNITISDVLIRDCWGDGIYLGGSEPVGDILIDSVVCDNNRRQGLSVTNAARVTITNSTFKNTNGTAPESGIDIEPNEGQATRHITMLNTRCHGNAGSGLSLYGGNEKIEYITVSGCAFNDNAMSGIVVDNAGELQFSDTSTLNNHTGIEIPRDAANVRFTGMTISGNLYRGVSLVTSQQRTGVSDIVFESTVFSSNSRANPNNMDGVRIDKYDPTGYIERVIFRSCRFGDNRQEKTQRYGLTVGFTAGMSGILVEKNCTFAENIAGPYVGNKALTVA